MKTCCATKIVDVPYISTCRAIKIVDVPCISTCRTTKIVDLPCISTCRTTKIVDLPCISTCRATAFECLRHILFSSRQGTTYLKMTSKSCSLSHFEHSSAWYLTLIPWLPCYITFISHKNDIIIIVKLLYRATSRRRVALWSLTMIMTSFLWLILLYSMDSHGISVL